MTGLRRSLNLSRFDEALAELDLSDAGAAPSADALKMRGEIYMQQKKWKEAGDALKQAISLSPKDSELAEWMGHVDIELRDYPGAVRILEQVYAQNRARRGGASRSRRRLLSE